MAKAKEETEQQRRDRINAEHRAEAHSTAHNVAPLSAGNELADGSDERKAKVKEGKSK